MEMRKEVDRVISELTSVNDENKASCSSGLYGALIVLRTTLIKSKEAVAYLLQAGCVKALLNLLHPPDKIHAKWLKTVDIVISILANLCLEEKAREQVLSNRGLSIIVEATVSSEKETIHNRGTRAVANLVQHAPPGGELFDLEFPAFVGRRLMETQDKDCKLTYLRAIRLFGQTDGQVKRLVEGSRCLQAVAAMLKEDNRKSKERALRILSQFSGFRCCSGFVEQVLASDVLEELVLLCEDTISDDIAFFSVSVMMKLCEHGTMRAALGAAGLIPCLMRLLEVDKPHINHVSVLNVLCLCSKEAVNRQRLYQENALELFMAVLDPDHANGKYSVLHDRIISILINFLYNDECLAKLLELDLVPLLMRHLERVCGFNATQEDWHPQMVLMSTKFCDGDRGSENSGGVEGSNEIKDKSTVEIICDKSEDRSLDVDMDTSEKYSESAICESGHFDASAKNVIPDQREEEEELKEETVATLDEENVTCPLEEEERNSLDQEVMEISMEDTKMLPSPGSASRQTFSINSPTYQIEHHSWCLEDLSSGVTCKSFSPHRSEDSRYSKWNPEVKFSPYSPLSAGASYYSPTHSSPTHSVGSSPRPPSFQLPTSPSQTSEWSPSSSSHFDDNGNSLEQGLSPEWQAHTPRPGQFSPLINHYPASPPMGGESDNSRFNTQTSVISNSTRDSQEDIFQRSPNPAFLTESTSQSSGSTLTVLPGLNQGPIYSASEDEEEGEEEEEEKEEVAVKRQSGLSCNDEEEFKTAEIHVPCTSSSSQKEDLSLKGREKSESIGAKTNQSKNETQNFNEPLRIQPQPSLNREQSEVLVLSDTQSLSSMSPISRYSSVSPNSSPNPYQKNRRSGGSGNSSTITTTATTFQISKELLPQSPGMSAAAASPSPRHRSLSSHTPPERMSHHYSHPMFKEVVAGTDGDDRVSPPVPAASSEELSGATVSNINSSSYGKKRIKKIQRTTESNILVLLSRISLKTNPTAYLVRYSVLSTLTSYLGVTPQPFQRCMRAFLRVCNNPLCFETLLKKQAPTLIVRNLILEQDGTFPSVLSKTSRGSDVIDAINSRRINFDEMFPSSQHSSDATTASDFSLRMEFEFGGDAYSRIMSSSSACHFTTTQLLLDRSISLDSQCARDNLEVFHAETSDSLEDQVRSRVSIGISLLRALGSVALSRYGQGEIQRVWARGSTSDRLSCAVSLLHMPIGCGPMNRRRLISETVLNQLLPLVFVEEAQCIRESIVTALSLLTHLVGSKKQTPRLVQLEPCPDIHHGDFSPSSSLASRDGRSRPDCDKVKLSKTSCSKPSDSGRRGEEEEEGVSVSQRQSVFCDINASTTYTKEKDKCESKTKSESSSIRKDKNLCRYESLSSTHNLNLLVDEGMCGVGKKTFGACKDVLMRKSDVFSAMLGGSYLEAGKQDITFGDVSISGFEYILHYLHGCASGCPVIDSLSLSTIPPPSPIHNVNNIIIRLDLGDRTSPKFTEECQDANKNHTDLHTTADTDEIQIKSNPTKETVFSPSTSSSTHTSPSSISPRTRTSPAIITTKATTTTELDTTSTTNTTSIIIKSQNPTEQDATTATALDDSNTTTAAASNRIHAMADKCLDTLTVADRFLLHDLVQYLASVLSHACLCSATCREIFYAASNYKLSGLVWDCILESLLRSPQSSGRDVASLYLSLGQGDDNGGGGGGVRETILEALRGIVTMS